MFHVLVLFIITSYYIKNKPKSKKDMAGAKKNPRGATPPSSKNKFCF